MQYKTFDLPNDWDWLIILDACRYDFFVKNWGIGKVEPRISLDSCTLGVLRKFPHVKDSIILTGHPFVLMHGDCFERKIDAGFDFKLNTSPPWLITRKLIGRMWQIKQHKHKILWFLQPHYPFIGETKLNIPIFENIENGAMPPQEKIEALYREAKRRGILEKAYEDNLKLVIRELIKILRMIKGTIIITSDHGDGLGKPIRPGDPPVYSHPCSREELELRLIPYVVINH